MSKESLQKAFEETLASLTTIEEVQQFIATGVYRQFELSQLDAFYAIGKKLEELSGKELDPLKLAEWISGKEAEKAKAWDDLDIGQAKPAILGGSPTMNLDR